MARARRHRPAGPRRAPGPELARLVGQETFRPSRRELLPELEAALAAAGPGDPVACELAGFWRARRDVIDALVDWDEAVLGPRERDLMFVVGGVGHGLVGPDDTAAFFEGYGRVDVDPRLLAWYRCAWAVQDICAYGEQVLLVPGRPEAARRAELAGLEDLLAPGNIVDHASR